MSAPYPGTGVPAEHYAERRRRVLEALGRDAMILASGEPPTYSRDTEYRFRPDSDLYWLTGFTEPEAVLVLRPDADEPVTLFVRPRDPEAEVWTGRRAGPEGAKRDFGVDGAYVIDELDARLRDLVDGAERLHYLPWQRPHLDEKLRTAFGFLRAKERFGHRAPSALVDPGLLLHEMRLIKTPEEIEVLARAAEISARGHIAGMLRCRPGAMEYQVQAAIEGTFMEEGAPAPGFATIVGSGANGCILHYIENIDEIRAGELVLVDAGAEYGGYNGDITRTFPADGQFRPAQRQVYDIVLDTLERCLAAAKPGASIDGIHELSLRRLTEGLVELGLLEGSIDGLLDQEAYKKYFMHRTSHWLGADVHDVGRYRAENRSRPLEPGMVFTIEPGLYIPPDDEAAAPELRGVAVRIEDDVVITPDGHRNLTRTVPVEADAVADLVTRDSLS
jgi:Xaa-Pro aminopeptidase